MKVAVVGTGAIGAHVGTALHRPRRVPPGRSAQARNSICGRPGPGASRVPDGDTTVRAHCGVGRNLTLHVQDNDIVKVTSPHDNPVTHGNLCIKGRFGFQHVQNRV